VFETPVVLKPDNPVGLLWVEKYRPSSIEEMALDPKDRTLLESFITSKEIPHLLFTGPPGSGKTTVARILTKAIECDLMMLNASKDRGIDTVRDRVGTFAKVLGFSKWKVVFLDEADGMTADAQNSLRNLMEDFHDQTRFIFTANYPHKVISPIHSRCTEITFGETPLKERITILAKILNAEHVPFEMTDALAYAERYRDLRRMIMAAQKSVLSSPEHKLGPASESVVNGLDLMNFVVLGDWDRMVQVAQNPSFDHRKGLTDMFWAVGMAKVKKHATVRYKLAKAVHESTWTPDPVVHFLGTVAELMADG
jgi:DNA polymerase III delta prime subunit